MISPRVGGGEEGDCEALREYCALDTYAMYAIWKCCRRLRGREMLWIRGCERAMSVRGGVAW